AVVIFAAALLMSGAAHAQSPGAGLSNLFGNIFSGPNSSPPAAPQSGSGPLPWSGEDGASGHPLMTAGAIRQAAANFDNCIAAIWGIESNYSTQVGDRSVLQSTATLSCIGRRQAYFRDEFLSALEILNRGDLKPEQLRGSWAGAFGPTQFMPTAFKRYAVDADGDGRSDVVDDPADLIASTANNLKKDGWQAGQSWGYEVVG